MELTKLFESLPAERDIRAVVIRGTNGTFCAGGDIRDMRALETRVDDQGKRNQAIQLNQAFGRLLALINENRVPVITVVEGAAVGGGMGLSCASDITLASVDCWFRMPEVTLGLPPAQIIPYVVQRVGLSHARRLCLAACRIAGREAAGIGLVHELFDNRDQLESGLSVLLDSLKASAPVATASTKRLLFKSLHIPTRQFIDEAGEAWANAVFSDEGREGLSAIMERRPPNWCPE